MRLESADEFAKKRSEMGGRIMDGRYPQKFSTEHLFNLIDIRGYRYLDQEGIQIFME